MLCPMHADRMSDWCLQSDAMCDSRPQARDIATKVGWGTGAGWHRKRSSSSNAGLALAPTTAPVGSQSWWAGIGASVFAGMFAAVQWSAVTLGKRHEQRSAGCTCGLCGLDPRSLVPAFYLTCSLICSPSTSPSTSLPLTRALSVGVFERANLWGLRSNLWGLRSTQVRKRCYGPPEHRLVQTCWGPGGG